MASDFGATFAAAGLGGVASGLLIQWNHFRLERDQRRKGYIEMRRHLVRDVLHGLKTLDEIWMSSHAPYHTVPNPDEQWREYWLQGQPIRFMGNRPYALRFEMWGLAKQHLLQMAPDPTDGSRFAEAFQLLRACLAEPDEDASPLWYERTEPDTIYQKSGITDEGHQIYGVPQAVFKAIRVSDAKQQLVTLVMDFGTDEEAAQAATIAENDWSAPKSWHLVDGVWVAANLVPTRAGAH